MPAPRRRGYKELSLSQLRSFSEVCRVGGYAAAARRIELTTPAVWEQMQALERYYGVPLLERHGPGVRPTVHGERLLEMIRPLIAGLDTTREVLRQVDGSLPGHLTLITNLRVLVDEISRAIKVFHAKYPTIRLRVEYTGIDEVGPRIVAGEADVALTLEPGPDQPTPTETLYEPVGELDYLLITPRRHALAVAATLHLEEIVAHPLVLAVPGAYSRRRVQEVFHRHELTHLAQVVVETSSDEYTLSSVRAGLGVGITLGMPQGRLYHSLGVRPLRRWFGVARVGFLWKGGAQVPPAQRILADALRSGLDPDSQRASG